MSALFPDHIAYPLHEVDGWLFDRNNKAVDLAELPEEYVLPFRMLRGSLVDADGTIVNPHDWYAQSWVIPARFLSRLAPSRQDQTSPEPTPAADPSPQDP
jgi:hypothetical protein